VKNKNMRKYTQNEKIKNPIGTLKRKNNKKTMETEETDNSSWFNFELR
jgi:hypothetical protein